MSRVAALLAAPAAAICLLSGCGAGQVNQTSSMKAPVAGVNVTSKPHGQATLLDVEIKYNSPEGYPVGATAPLSMGIANNDPGKPLVLRSVTATDRKSGAPIGTVVLLGGTPNFSSGPAGQPSASATGESSASASASSSASAVPSVSPAAHRASAAPSATPSRRAAASGSPAASESAAPSESPSESPSSAARSGSPARLTIPPNGYVRLDPDQGAYLAITNISTALQPGSSVLVTFTFEGEDPLRVPVPFGIPLSPAPRTGEPSGAAAE